MLVVISYFQVRMGAYRNVCCPRGIFSLVSSILYKKLYDNDFRVDYQYSLLSNSEIKALALYSLDILSFIILKALALLF